ncbi:photosystem I assembly protein Ycf3 [Planctomycetes bacterium CA13]|uniref:Photosystem I assembly protein Ycf3 n=1 Tax=Novipirellula herctigrandis TaxID=2527986 RepID=A0A5C5ZC14_9BACT|nr:photosystem I assembly protein Ycf3 [Planctomycetes bacterium CA13]
MSDLAAILIVLFVIFLPIVLLSYAILWFFSRSSTRKIPDEEHLLCRIKTSLATPEGDCRSFSTTKISVTDKAIYLGRQRIAVGSIVDVKRTASVLRVFHSGSKRVLAMWPGKRKGKKLEQAINSALALHRLDDKLEKYHANGLDADIRVHDCPFCKLPTDLTPFPPAPQVYCPYCKEISNAATEAEKGHHHREGFCDLCGHYLKIETYSTVFLMFLLIMVWAQSNTFDSCSECGRRRACIEFWKCLILGTFTAPIGMIINGYAYCRTLFAARANPANRLVHKRQYNSALDEYAQLVAQNPKKKAGLLNNIGIIHANMGKFDSSIAVFEEAIEACPNCLPLYSRLAIVHQKAGNKTAAEQVEDRIEALF